MDKIKIRGLIQNNLKNIDLDISKHKIVIFTGVSGPGKSSIVFDTIATESGRQLNETFAAFIRGKLPHNTLNQIFKVLKICHQRLLSINLLWVGIFVQQLEQLVICILIYAFYFLVLVSLILAVPRVFLLMIPPSMFGIRRSNDN